MKKKYIVILATLAALVLLGTAGILIRKNHQRQLQEEFDRTYLVVDGRQIPRDSAALNLSGTPLSQWEKLPELTGLKQLDLTGTGITVQTYETLAAAMPGCDIRWSVPLQGAYYDPETTLVSLSSTDAEDLALLDYLPNLTAIDAENCEDYKALALLQQTRPDLDVRYAVPIGAERYGSSITEITLTDPDISDLREALPYLPKLVKVTLIGKLPEMKDLLALKDDFPLVVFVWEFDFFGVRVNTLTEEIDISKVKLKDTLELETLLPYFYNLKRLDMRKCGLPHQEMARLSDTYADTLFVWEVIVCGYFVPTDIVSFMPFEYGMIDSEYADFSNLRYCKDLVLIDMGHYTIPDISFIRYLPKLEYLMICDSQTADLNIIGQCTNLKFLEVFLNPITDFWPLVNLTNLEDLNISYTPLTQRTAPRRFGKIGDITPLLQMPWLDRLWVSGYENITEEEKQILREALPNTQLCFQFGSSTTCGWRHSPNYYIIRDMQEMPYMLS